MKSYLSYQLVIFSALLFVGSIFTGESLASSKETLIIAGNGSSIGIMKQMADGFQKRHPGVSCRILPSIGSTGGIKAVKEGKIDIGLSARSLRPEERIPEIVEGAYGRTALIFAVPKSNPIEGLSLTGIEEIYAGKRRTWPDGQPIRIILRPRSDTYSVFLAGISPGMKSASEKAHSMPGMFVGLTDHEAAFQIEKTPGSFGITCAAVVAAEELNIKAVSVDGRAPTLANVVDGTYPYTMTMSVVYKKDRHTGAMKDFIDFIFSKDGRKILSANECAALSRMAGR